MTESATLSPYAVYVSNLPYEATRQAVVSKFADAGITVSSVQLVHKGVLGRMKHSGLATVLLSSEADIDKACTELDGSSLYDRPMIVRKDKFVEDNIGYNKDDRHKEAEKRPAPAVKNAPASPTKKTKPATIKAQR